MIVFILLFAYLEKDVSAQWEACLRGPIAISVNSSDTLYALSNGSGVLTLPPGTSCSFQIQPLPLTVMYISFTGSNFTNSTVTYYDGNTAYPLTWQNPNPIEYTIPPSASAYVVAIRRMSNETPASFAMKIRGEPVNPGEVFLSISSNATLRVLPGEYKQSSTTFFAPEGYRVGVMVDAYTSDVNASDSELLDLMRSAIFFTNTTYIASAAMIYTSRNGIYQTGQQYLTMFYKANSTDKINLLAFSYKESSNILWSIYSFSDIRRGDFVLNVANGSGIGAKVISKIGDSGNGVLENATWGTATQLDIYEGLAEINTSVVLGKLITSLNRTSTISSNNTIKLRSPVYTFVNRGGSMNISLVLSTQADNDKDNGKSARTAYFGLIPFFVITAAVL